MVPKLLESSASGLTLQGEVFETCCWGIQVWLWGLLSLEAGVAWLYHFRSSLAHFLVVSPCG